MDTVTQMLFGATVAQAGFRRRLGRVALPVGAAVALIPDLDVFAGWIGGPFVSWQHHRGITHSLLFALVAGPLLGWAVWRLQQGRDGGLAAPAARSDLLRSWIYLAIAALITHPLIDLFTSYGTQLLAPFSDHRFAVDAMPIIDPAYSLVLVLALAVGIFARHRPRLAQDSAAAALVLVAVYTAYGWSVNGRVEAEARRQLGTVAEVAAYPTLFQPYYRRVVAETEDAVLIGYYSVLNPGPIAWRRLPRAHDPRVEAAAALPRARLFQWFAMDRVIWSIEENGDGTATVTAMDSRYGLPGNAEAGFWGIRVVVDAAGQALTPVVRVEARREVSGEVLRGFWRAVLGSRD